MIKTIPSLSTKCSPSRHGRRGGEGRRGMVRVIFSADFFTWFLDFTTLEWAWGD
jgi:hypothetical protein